MLSGLGGMVAQGVRHADATVSMCAAHLQLNLAPGLLQSCSCVCLISYLPHELLHVSELHVFCAGMALGTGSALAHRAVDSVLGSRHPEPAQAQVLVCGLYHDWRKAMASQFSAFAHRRHRL